MYLHLGSGAVIRAESLIGIFDMDTSTVSARTRAFLSRAEGERRCVTVSPELPGSFAVTAEKDAEFRVYISQLSVSALNSRALHIKKIPIGNRLVGGKN